MTFARRTVLKSSVLLGAPALLAAEAQAASAPTVSVTEVDRGFVRISDGQVHFRAIGWNGGKPRKTAHLPLYMAHAGPGSSAGSVPLMQALAQDRIVIAPDNLGAGDSAPPAVASPDVAYYAESVVRILDALGIRQVDFYGAHTGTHIGCELALRAPTRVRKLVFNGVALFSDELKVDLLKNYAPPQQADDAGRQLAWAWQFIRDMSLFFPHYAHDAAHRLNNPVNSAEALNRGVVDVLKVLPTYHLGYHAVFRHDVRSRLPQLHAPVLCMCTERDPLSQYLDEAARLVPGAKKMLIPRNAGPDEMPAAIRAFLNA